MCVLYVVLGIHWTPVGKGGGDDRSFRPEWRTAGFEPPRASGLRSLRHPLGRPGRPARNRRHRHAAQARGPARVGAQLRVGRAGHPPRRARVRLFLPAGLERRRAGPPCRPARSDRRAAAAPRGDDRPARHPAPGAGPRASRAGPLYNAGGTPMTQLERLSTGSAALDRILGGGLPARSLTLVAGEPGSGKTLFALQMFFHLARQGKKCVYFTTLSEPALKLIHYMQQFAFFDEAVIGKQLVFVDLGQVLREHDADEVLAAIADRVEKEKPVAVVIDSFKAMRDILGDAPAVRTFVYDLAVQMAGWGAATLFVGEYTETEIAEYAEFAIADGILRFSTRRDELTAVRMIEVGKLRGADCIMGRHFFEIDSNGLTFYPRVRSPDETSSESIGSFAERAGTGIAGLDEMLGGGLPRSGATVIMGATGTGKTLVGMQFLLEGARRGEPGVHFTLEETPDQLRAIAQGFGWDLRDLEKRKLLTIRYVSPVDRKS